MIEALETVNAATSWSHSAEDTRRRLEAIARDVRELASAEGASQELLRILPALGPVFSGFARFLATRADVVPSGLRSDFATVPDAVPAAPVAEIRAVIEAAWKRSIRDVCFDFEDTPLETRFPVQTHRAWLSPTDSIVVSAVPEPRIVTALAAS